MLAWLLDEMMMMMRCDHHNALISTTSTSCSHVMLVAATNRLDSIPLALCQPGCFNCEIPLAPPTVMECYSILNHFSCNQAVDSSQVVQKKWPTCCHGAVRMRNYGKWPTCALDMWPQIWQPLYDRPHCCDWPVLLWQMRYPTI